MTKPFLFNDLRAATAPLMSEETDEPHKLVAEEGCDSTFPRFAFDRPTSKKTVKTVPAYTAEDLAAALDKARQAITLDVEAKTRAVMSTEISHRQTQALEAIRDQLGASEALIERWMDDLLVTAERLALMLGQAVVPRALEQQPLADIGDMVRQSLLRLIGQPSIELRLEADLVEQAADLMKEICLETGYQGQLMTVADAALGPGDAKLIWKDGVADRNLKRIKNEVDWLIEGWFHDTPSPIPIEQTGAESDSLLRQADAIDRSSPPERQTPEEQFSS